MRAVAPLVAVCAIASRSAAAGGPRDDLWARILRAHVNIAGDIAYRTLATRDRPLLERYL
ncbi:MAG: hypothetical protein QOD06_3316, partial [Candidatus Binatota bacterium]|nr:hypothetical protein [Candidatus Binatota bacterium]